MCGRATVVNPDGIIEKVYGYTSRFVPTDWKPRYNLNPHQDIPVVYYDPVLKQRALRLMHWNLIPSRLESRASVDAFDRQYSTFNARIETVDSAPSFREPWRNQRCLVVVDGIIEWMGDKRNRIPHLIRQREGNSFAMAGLWSHWRDPSGEDEVWSCTILVRDADDWYRRFHDRMATLLGPTSYDAWLDPTVHGGQLDLLDKGAYKKDDELEFYPISRRVNNTRNDDADCVQPANLEDFRPLQGELGL